MFRYSYSTNEDLGCVASNTVATENAVMWDTVKALALGFASKTGTAKMIPPE
jgi:hypothetical protein